MFLIFCVESLLSVEIENHDATDGLPVEILSPNHPSFLVGGIRKSWVITSRQRTVLSLKVCVQIFYQAY